MSVGIVKWWNDFNGFGFTNFQGVDYFLHSSEVQSLEYPSLADDQKVEFEPSKTFDGTVIARYVRNPGELIDAHSLSGKSFQHQLTLNFFTLTA